MIQLDNGFFARAEALVIANERDALKQAMLTPAFLSDKPDGTARAISERIDAVWSEAQANFAINHAANLTRYTLIILTQSQWTANPRHYAYARRMIGMPELAWRLESGIVAVYENVVAAHYLAPALAAFVAGRTAPLAPKGTA